MDRNNSGDVLVLDPNGTNLGNMSYQSAQQLAIDRNLDLVQINKNNGELPVYKIMDRGKWQYLKKKGQKKSSSQVLKEINFRVRIDDRDREIKINHIKRFLSKGMDVKIAVQMRGREKANPSFAKEKMDTILSELNDLVLVKQRKSSGSLIVAVVRSKQGKCNAGGKNNKEENN